MNTLFNQFMMLFIFYSNFELLYGKANFTAPIEDIDFLKRIENNDVSFAKNDFLICEVEEKQISTSKGLRIERIIKKVLEHRSAGKQRTLI